MTGAVTIHADMRAAFRARLRTIAGLPSLVAWEGRRFTATAGQPFVRESFRPITSVPRAVGRGGTIAHRINGILTLFFPSGDGTLAIEEAAGLILAGFAPGTSLVHGSAAGSVQQAERGALMVEPDWLSCPVTVSILAYTAN